jgi:NTP pyrophosphatase (non-canonical NTP hydrolase)
MTELEIYQTALDKWGEDSQLEMLVEECAELIQAIQHLKRGRGGFAGVLHEAADVQVVLNQIRLLEPIHFDRIHQEKISNLANKLVKVEDGHS